MSKLMMLLCVILCAVSANALGVVHFTDSPESIPPAYRHSVIKSDDITLRDPKIREEVERDEERAKHEQSTSTPMQVVEPTPLPQPVAPTPPPVQKPDSATKPSEPPVWNLCAPGMPPGYPCAPGRR
jgi:hypothetical protein